jgi:GTPase SAR1 family protein
MPNQQPTKSRNRNSGFLTDEGLNKIQNAIASWLQEKQFRHSYPKIAEEADMSSDSVKNILMGKKTADYSSLHTLFVAFGLNLTEKDWERRQNENDILEAPETRWVGRQKLIEEIIEKFQKDCRILSIVGLTGIGKTSLAYKLTQESQRKKLWPLSKRVDFYSELPKFETVARCVLGEQIPTNHDDLLWAMVARLKSHPCLLVIDMIESVLEADKGSHRFIEPIFSQFLDRIVVENQMPSRIIFTSQDKLPIIADNRFPNRVSEELLPGLSDEEARELFALWNVTIQTDLDAEYLSRIIKIYEGHPLVLRVIACEILEDYQGNIEAYWYEFSDDFEEVERLKTATEGDPSHDKPRIERVSEKVRNEVFSSRIEKTFQRLQQAYPLACKLFCMGGLFRRPVERREWLLLLDDYLPDDEKKDAFDTLLRRCFLEVKIERNKRLFRLHALMRGVALDNLKKLEDEEP